MHAELPVVARRRVALLFAATLIVPCLAAYGAPLPGLAEARPSLQEGSDGKGADEPPNPKKPEGAKGPEGTDGPEAGEADPAKLGKIRVRGLPAGCTITCKGLGLDRAKPDGEKWSREAVPPGNYELLFRWGDQGFDVEVELMPYRILDVKVDMWKLEAKTRQVLPFSGFEWDMAGTDKTWTLEGDSLVVRNPAQRPVSASAGKVDWTDYLVTFDFLRKKGDFVFGARGEKGPEGGWEFDSCLPPGDEYASDAWHTIEVRVEGQEMTWTRKSDGKKRKFSLGRREGPIALLAYPESEIRFRNIQIRQLDE